MAITINKDGKGKGKKSIGINKSIETLEKDSFFEKKVRDAEAFLKKHGVPKPYSK